MDAIREFFHLFFSAEGLTQLIQWGGLVGLPVGLWLGRSGTSQAGVAGSQRSMMSRLLRLVVWLALILTFGALLLVAAGRALPPLGLVTQDIGALAGWVVAALRREPNLGGLPAPRAWAYLGASVPRFWESPCGLPWSSLFSPVPSNWEMRPRAANRSQRS